jgi:Rhodopirellula transposase DDE domain
MRRKVASEKKGGRKKASLAQPDLLPAVEALIEEHTAGSPVDQNIRWTNCSAGELAMQLQELGFQIGPDALRRILFDELGLSQRQAFKDESGCNFPQRDEQFQFIERQRKLFERKGLPVLSIDTKKKEILGNFFHPGRAYTDGRVRVQDHDFVTAEQRLTPYGVYDTVRNEGLMYLATGPDTSLLACDAIWAWWEQLGSKHYLHVPKLLLLCDCGGSNGYRQQRFKQDLCDLATLMLCDIQVAHYPPGCSKYNPIEHRMFCHVTRSLQAVVLKTIDVARDFITRTSTALGLHVLAEISKHIYEKGRKATAEFLDVNPIRYNTFLPQLNYTAPWLY